MIAVDQLRLEAGARLLVEQLDWRVGKGECWSIIGRNGAGKSTLLRTLAGMREADGGAVSMDGRALGQCLGHPIQTIEHAGRTIFMALE